MNAIGPRTLGAIIAGGRSTRFGSDKAVADVAGRSMIERIADALAPQVDFLVICGRESPPHRCIEDRPMPHLGPIGGLNAALRYAADHGFADVLTVPVDVFPVVTNLRQWLGTDRPAVFAQQHLIGLWPAALAQALNRYVADGGRKVAEWQMLTGTTFIDPPVQLHNINYRQDLAALSPLSL